MKLYPVYAKGIKAYCSDLIVDPYEYESVYFLSICGYQTTVKGIIANFLEYYGISINIEGVDHNFNRTYLSYSFNLKKLPSGLVHAVVFPKLALPQNNEEKQNSFIIFTKETQEILSQFYRHLDEKIEIPLHPSWDSWLWQIFNEQENWTIELKTLIGIYKGYLFEFTPQQLQEHIADSLKSRESDIIKCMKRKGDLNHEFNFS